MVRDGALRRVPPRSWRRIGYAFGTASVVLLAMTIAFAYDAWTQRGWRDTGGVITSTRPEGLKDVQVVYEFRADAGRFSGRERRQKSLGLAPGAAVVVRYDPIDPTRSTTRPWIAEWGAAALGLVGAVVTSGISTWSFGMARS